MSLHDFGGFWAVLGLFSRAMRAENAHSGAKEDPSDDYLGSQALSGGLRNPNWTFHTLWGNGASRAGPVRADFVPLGRAGRMVGRKQAFRGPKMVVWGPWTHPGCYGTPTGVSFFSEFWC